jgi:D-sedoheptulose 7-phosphate isomerase
MIKIADYVRLLGDCMEKAEATDRNGKTLGAPKAVFTMIKNIVDRATKGKKVIFVGNGGSSSIASHMAIDFWKNGRMKAVCFNDPAQLTCLANDLGYERVFSAPMEMFAQKGDILVAISSSGRSANILNAARSGRKKGCWVVTFSGFGPKNPLRRLGDVNFYIQNNSYGIVESAHSVICHYVLDAIMDLK